MNYGCLSAKIDALKELTPEETSMYFIKYISGDLSAKEIIYNGNLRLVLYVINKFFSDKQKDVEDIFQEGSKGLVRAIEKFDISKKTQFSTFAVIYIRGYIKKYFKRAEKIHQIEEYRVLLEKMKQLGNEWLKKHGRVPTMKELCKILHVYPSHVNSAIAITKGLLYLDSPIANDNTEKCFRDIIPDKENALDSLINYIDIMNAYNKLNEEQQDLLYERYFLGKTQTEIGNERGMQKMTMSNTLKKIYNEMRPGLER